MCHMSDTVDLPTDNLYDFLRYGFATDRTGIRLRFALRNRCRKTVTARISATSTVVAGQRLTHFDFFLVYFYFKFLACHARRIPAKIPTIPMTAAAYKIDAPISSPPLNQTIQSKESDCHKTGCDQHDRRSFEAFRYIVFINLLPDTCHYDDCNCKSDCGEHTVDDRFPDV